MKSRPNLFLIGGMRCGSTTLNLVLSQHPEIFMSEVKEPLYWFAKAMRAHAGDDPELLAEADNFVKAGKHRTDDTYAALFSDAAEERWVGESSHYLYHGHTAPLIHDHCPDARIVVVLRDPTDRFFSEYLYRRREAKLDIDFEDFALHNVDLDPSGEIAGFRPGSRLRKGVQAELLKPWFDQFGDQVYLVWFGELESTPMDVASKLFGWLGISQEFRPTVVHTQRGGIPRYPALKRALNLRDGPLAGVRRAMPKTLREGIRSKLYANTLERPEMPPELEARIRRFYKSDIEELEAMTGRDLSGWKAS